MDNLDFESMSRDELVNIVYDLYNKLGTLTKLPKNLIVDDAYIKSLFKKLKKLNYDNAKKANLRKIILEFEATKSPLLYIYLHLQKIT